MQMMKKQKMTGLAPSEGQLFDALVPMFHEGNLAKEEGEIQATLAKLIMMAMIQMIIQTQATTHTSTIDERERRR